MYLESALAVSTSSFARLYAPHVYSVSQRAISLMRVTTGYTRVFTSIPMLAYGHIFTQVWYIYLCRPLVRVVRALVLVLVVTLLLGVFPMDLGQVEVLHILTYFLTLHTVLQPPVLFLNAPRCF